MNVYMIRGDGDYFGASFLIEEQFVAFYNVEYWDKKITEAFEVAGWYYSGDSKEEPVFTDFGYLGTGTTLILRRPRTDILRPMLREVGTILPMTPWKGQELEAFICDTQLDAFDPAAMVRYPDDHDWFPGDIMRYAFKADVVAEATVFRAKGLPGRMFATDRFLDQVKAGGLTGLQTLALWSTDEGPIATIDDPMIEFVRFPPGFGANKREKRAAMRAILEKRG